MDVGVWWVGLRLLRIGTYLDEGGGHDDEVVIEKRKLRCMVVHTYKLLLLLLLYLRAYCIS